MWNKKRKRFFFNFPLPEFLVRWILLTQSILRRKSINILYYDAWWYAKLVWCLQNLALFGNFEIHLKQKKVQVSQGKILKLLVQSFKFHDVSNSNVKFLSKNSADYSIISKHESILQASFLMLKMHTIPSERALIDISFGTTTTTSQRRCSNSSSLLLWTDRRTDVLLTELISLYGPQPNTKVGFI